MAIVLRFWGFCGFNSTECKSQRVIAAIVRSEECKVSAILTSAGSLGFGPESLVNGLNAKHMRM